MHSSIFLSVVWKGKSSCQLRTRFERKREAVERRCLLLRRSYCSMKKAQSIFCYLLQIFSSSVSWILLWIPSSGDIVFSRGELIFASLYNLCPKSPFRSSRVSRQVSFSVLYSFCVPSTTSFSSIFEINLTLCKWIQKDTQSIFLSFLLYVFHESIFLKRHHEGSVYCVSFGPCCVDFIFQSVVRLLRSSS